MRRSWYLLISSRREKGLKKDLMGGGVVGGQLDVVPLKGEGLTPIV